MMCFEVILEIFTAFWAVLGLYAAVYLISHMPLWRRVLLCVEMRQADGVEELVSRITEAKRLRFCRKQEIAALVSASCPDEIKAALRAQGIKCIIIENME